MAQVVNSDIQRLKKMKGNSRIWRKNKVSDFILSLDYRKFPGIQHQFLESRLHTTEKGEWIEHKLLLKGMKNLESAQHLGFVIESLGELITILGFSDSERELEGIGIEEIDSKDPNYYYFLIYLISDGKDYNEEETYNITSSNIS